ncbi:hypothetical protein COCNU_scaffold000186G000010 [Cocos nucifera]|nr:hypothetical protein [Cocos nucifera]
MARRSGEVVHGSKSARWHRSPLFLLMRGSGGAQTVAGMTCRNGNPVVVVPRFDSGRMGTDRPMAVMATYVLHFIFGWDEDEARRRLRNLEGSRSYSGGPAVVHRDLAVVAGAKKVGSGPWQ